MIIYLFSGLISLAMIGVLWISIISLIRFKQQDKDIPTTELNEEIDYSHPVLLVEKGGRIKYQSSGITDLLDQKRGQKFDFNLLAKKANNKEFYKIFGVQFLIGMLCFLNVKLLSAPYFYFSGSIFILFSAWYSLRELNRRMDLITLIRDRISNRNR